MAADQVPAGDSLPKMEYRFLGASGLYVSVIGLAGGLSNNETGFACLKAAYDAGINLFDMEGQGILGEAIRRFGWPRCDLVITTTLYYSSRRGQSGFSRKHIIEGMDASLKELGLEYVDLVYAYKPNGVTSMEVMVRAFNHLIDTGKAFYWGTIGWTEEEITDAWRVAEKVGLIGPLVSFPFGVGRFGKAEV